MFEHCFYRDVQSANYDFFERLEQTCCRELKHFEMAVFKPSTTDSRPAVLGVLASVNPPASESLNEQSPKAAATSGHRDILKYEGGASSLSLALSLSKSFCHLLNVFCSIVLCDILYNAYFVCGHLHSIEDVNMTLSVLMPLP